MNSWKVLSLVSIIVLWSVSTVAQDPLKVDTTHYKLVFENASVRVLRVDIAPGAKSPMHSHPDALVVFLAASKVRFTLPDGKSQDSDAASESAMYTPAGAHSPSNIGTTRGDAIVVEFKAAAPGKATLPASREGMAIKMLAEGPRAMAYRSTATATFAEPAGTKHDYDQIVIALSPVQMSLALDGKPTKTNWTRGEAVFVGRGVAHEAKNISGKPVDFVIVAIR